MSRKIEIKIYENHWLFKFPVIKDYAAITLVPFILVKDKADEHTLFHENVYVRQVEENGILKFYFKYLFYFVINLFKYRNFTNAYYNIPFEIEAYDLTKKHFSK
jgi:hypothetical protein